MSDMHLITEVARKTGETCKLIHQRGFSLLEVEDAQLCWSEASAMPTTIDWDLLEAQCGIGLRPAGDR